MKKDLLISENTVVHCPTEELANEVLLIAHDCGYKWNDGDSILKVNMWNSYKTDACYRFLNSAGCADKNFYLRNNKQIIFADDFIKLHVVNSLRKTINALGYDHARELYLKELRSKHLPEKKEFPKGGIISKVPEFSCTPGWCLNIKENLIEKNCDKPKTWQSEQPFAFTAEQYLKEVGDPVEKLKELQEEIEKHMKPIKVTITIDLNIGNSITEAELNSGKKVKIQDSGIKRTVTVMVISIGNELYAGYSVLNPSDKFDLEKAKMICEGRAMNERSNLMKGETLGSIQGRHINRTIANDLLNRIEKGEIEIKGIK